ncbi:SDR family oxidoreductase [Petroclostridium xylanilyticum]|jgi:NAD(P)-dependent dehydrogenase (short-subunit alcohol dehydrogenase family)|uniref:SDR family oxidoreductase n=1 Tax=Petroclostridium xylanilyticum TaxID=1792311 RepID=UPI0018E3557E
MLQKRCGQYITCDVLNVESVKEAEKIISHTPMRRFGKPEDLLGTLIWLCDEEASGFVTGTVTPVDGGFMAYSGV